MAPSSARLVCDGDGDGDGDGDVDGDDVGSCAIDSNNHFDNAKNNNTTIEIRVRMVQTT